MNQRLVCVSTQVVPSIFAYQMLVQAGSTAILNPIGGAICTAIASSILATLGEYFGSYIPKDAISSSHKVYVIPSIWIISSFLTTITQFPIRFIAAISPIITLGGAITLVGLLALGSVYLLRTKSSPNSDQTQIPHSISPTPHSINPTSAETFSLDASRVSGIITTANRVLADIPELNRTRGVTEFPYTAEGDRKLYHSLTMDSRLTNDRDAAIAALHQKLAKHIDESVVVISPPVRTNCGLIEWGNPNKTFYTFSQTLLDARTRKVIASTRFNINQTDQSTFPTFRRSKVEGKLQSEIVMYPFEAVV